MNRPLDDPRAAALLGIVHDTLLELHQSVPRGLQLTLDSVLDRDLGLDSLARVELLMRVERAFGIELPENTLQTAETPRDLLAAIETAGKPAEGALAAAPTSSEFPGAAFEGEVEPVRAATLLEALEWHVRARPDRTHIVVLSDGREEAISYSKLHSGARSIATGLQRLGIQPRETVAIMLPTSPEYFYLYFGILLAGAIPVPIYPPARLSQIEEHVRRHSRILANAKAAVLVTVQEAMAIARLLEAHAPALRRIVTPAMLKRPPEELLDTPVRAEDIAFIQYTSGSTGDPKGVVLTHANLLANIRAMAQAVQATERDVFVSWLPLYHDMGLIGAWLGSLYVGARLVIMSPLAFLSRPQRWLTAIDRFRGTISAGPNFAYELCLNRIDDKDLEGVNLSSWRLTFNGAEAVNPDTVTRFSERFSRWGFRAESMTPVYGLAECSVGLLFPPPGRGPLIDRVQREPLALQREALHAKSDDTTALRFVACGKPLPRHEVRIVDETGLEVGERVEGRLEFKGPSATSGYFDNPGATERLKHGTWLDTGDRAYAAEGDIYITGRVKDIVIRGGRHVYPDEIEVAVGAIAGVRKGCVAVFGSPDPRAGTEKLVVLAETRETDAAKLDGLRRAINRVATAIVGEPPDDIVIAPPHTILKTSSGKVRRSATREVYESGAIGTSHSAPVWQLARLAMSAFVPELRRWSDVGRELLYAAYVFTAFWIVAPLTWLITALTPRPKWAWAIGGLAARLFFRITGTHFAVRGVENLPSGRPSVLVVNHSSYLDGVAVVASIPLQYRFVAKRELRRHFVPRVYLQRLGAVFVERYIAQQSVEDANLLALLVARGQSLVFFPEGTFTRVAGLMPFHLGAFTAAAEASADVVPVAIRGTRAMLRAGQWLPRRGTITVTITPPVRVPPDARSSFAAAVAMRDRARAQILSHCGEPSLS